MHREVRLERSIVVAAASHAAALGVLALTVHVHAPALLAPRSETAVEVFVEREARSDVASVVALREAPHEALRASNAIARPVSATASPSNAVTPSSEPIVTAPASASNEADGWTFAATTSTPPDTSAQARAMPGALLGHERAEGEDAPLPPATAAMNSVRSALDAHDRRVGLSAGSFLVEATREVVSAGRVPAKAHAQIEIRTDDRGVITSARVLDASSSMDAWEEVANKLAEGTRAKPVRLPSGSRGVVVTLKVESSLRMPSGHEAGPVGVSVVHVPVTSATGGHKINVTPLGASIDTDPTDMLLDATSKAQRVVTVSVAREERL